MRCLNLASAFLCAVGVVSTASAESAQTVAQTVAQSVAQSVAPGFCALSDDAAALPERIVGADPALRFVSCQELAEWRRGDRVEFDTFGSIAIVGDDHDGDGVFGPIKSAIGPGDIGAQLDLVAAALTEGDRAFLGVLENGEKARLTAELVRFEGRAGAHLHVTAVSQGRGGRLRRSLVLPYRDGDTLRYMLASLRASLAADQIALLNVH